jgi:hypothetical protein
MAGSITPAGEAGVVEDYYVKSGARFAAVIAIRLCSHGLAVVGVIAVLQLAFRS